MSRLFDLPDIFKIIESSSVDQPLAIMRIAGPGCSPMLVVPVDSRIGRKLFGQVFPVTTIFELIQHAVNQLSIVPSQGASALFLR